MTSQHQAILWRFLTGLIATSVPVALAVLQQPNPDYKLLALGLIGGLVPAFEKANAPQLATVMLPPQPH